MSKEFDHQLKGAVMGAHPTSSTTDGHSRQRAGRGRGAMLGALTTALLSLPAGAAAASPVETPPSPQHLAGISVCQEVADADLLGLTDGSLVEDTCENVNGWQ
ncbi:hypothetical protein [Streptomyces sp. TR06-5]|uniref:hypothetical protein n=1 Tax=unclassified Streptomyces TaxID=2593676 RepID=UPI0039A2076F